MDEKSSTLPTPRIRLELVDKVWLLAAITAMIGVIIAAFKFSAGEGRAIMPLFVFTLAISNFYFGLLTKRINALSSLIEQLRSEKQV